jgi:beta-lactamase class D
LKTGSLEKTIGEENCTQRYPACSTFKVPLAVMAFDTGVLKDENVVLKWDGKKGDREELNRDHDAKSWMKDSIVWFSQRLTPKMGAKKVQKYLDSFAYGNRGLNGGLTNAWLESPDSDRPSLDISPYEQLEFMKKLWTDQLPASERAMRLTREITYLETSANGVKLHGKTGSSFYEANQKMKLGWFIAHVQKGNQEYLSVTQFSDLQPSGSKSFGGPRARGITKRILADLGLW